MQVVLISRLAKAVACVPETNRDIGEEEVTATQMYAKPSRRVVRLRGLGYKGEYEIWKPITLKTFTL